MNITQDVEPKILDKHLYKIEFTIKNISKFEKKFCKLDWTTTLNSHIAELNFSCFFSIPADLFNSSHPMQKVKITYSKKNTWITKKLKDEIIKRDNYTRRVRKLQPKLIFLSIKNIKISQTSKLQRETIPENNLICKFVI